MREATLIFLYFRILPTIHRLIMSVFLSYKVQSVPTLNIFNI